MNHVLKTTSFLATWLFAFSLLSNCYCLPAFSPAPKAQPVAHCEHHSDSEKTKDADCAPRFHTDDIENLISQIKPIKQVARVFLPEIVSDIFHGSKQFISSSFEFEIRPSLNSSPPIYILVRSLLI
jgi:hypothetical protein